MDSYLQLKSDLRRALQTAARRNAYFTTDEVWDVAADMGIDVEDQGVDSRLLGSLLREAARADMIERTNSTRNSRSRRCHGRAKAVWKSLVCEVPQDDDAEELSKDALQERLEREEESLKHEIKSRDLRRKIASQRRMIDQLSERLASYEGVEEVCRQVDAVPSRLSDESVEFGSSDHGDSTLVVLASDWHVEEVVDPNEVPNNEFTPEIAEQRVNNFIRGVLAVRDMAPGNVERLVFALMGDFITGHIHEELIHSTALPPLEAMAFAEELLERCLDTFVEEFDEVVVPTCNGNHGRTTARSYYARNADFSLEHQSYVRLARRYRDRATFLISRARQNEDLVVYDRRLRFHHGEDCRASGGDVLAGLRKYHERQNGKTTKCDLSYVGHWHTASSSFTYGAVNGSLIGNTAYGLQYGAERPQQVYQLLCPTRGVIQTGPIFVE